MDFVVRRGTSLIRFGLIVAVTLRFAQRLLVLDWMYMMYGNCESREDHSKKQTEWNEEFVITKLSHK